MGNKVIILLVITLFFSCSKEEIDIPEVDSRNISRTPGKSYIARMGVKDGDIYVVWNDDMNTGYYTELFFRKREGGVWDSIEVVDSPEWGVEDNPVVMDSRGNLHLVYCTGKGRIYYREYSGGRWSERVLLSDTLAVALQPCIGIDGDDNIYVMWSYGYNSTGEGGAKLRVKRGGEWEDVIKHQNIEFTNPNMYVSSNGEIHVVYECGGTNHITYLHSSDGGNTWDEVVSFPNERPDGYYYYDWIPAVIEVEEYVYVFWTRSIAGVGIVGMYYSVKPPGGEFGDTTRVEMEMENPNVATLGKYGGYLYLAWRESDGPQTEVYLSKRQVPDGKWYEPVNVSKTETNSYAGEIEVEGGIVYLLWIEVLNNDEYDVYFEELKY